MRKLDLLHLSSRSIIANDAPDSPKIDVPLLPITSPDRSPPPDRDAPVWRRGKAPPGTDAAARNHASSVRMNKALRPRRRS